MKKKYLFIAMMGLLALAFSIVSSCSTTKNLAVANRSGAQLWGENCLRCHNTPSPETFSDSQWDVVVLHMQVRANLTQDEANKIADFLKTAN